MTIVEKRARFDEEGAGVVLVDRSFAFGRLAQMTSPVGRWFRDWAVRLTPASVNDRALRRIVTDMPGVPLPTERHA